LLSDPLNSATTTCILKRFSPPRWMGVLEEHCGSTAPFRALSSNPNCFDKDGYLQQQHSGLNREQQVQNIKS
jgi:hypothetical protein